MRDKKRAALWCAGVGGVLVLSAVVLGVVNMTVWDASVVGAAFANVLIGLGGLLVVLGVGLASGSGVALRMWVAPRIGAVRQRCLIQRRIDDVGTSVAGL